MGARSATARILRLAAGIVFAFGPAVSWHSAGAQNPPDGGVFWMRDPASVPLVEQRLKKGDFGPADLEVIALFEDATMTPLLEIRFAEASDPLLKGKIANVLVRLHDPDDRYWKYLEDAAEKVLSADPPDPMEFDADGKPKQDPPAAVVAWAKSHNLPMSEAAEDLMFRQPTTIAFIADSNDPRALPLLHKALKARNFMIKNSGAEGLALLQDRDSIPQIIDACQRSPREEARALAQALAYFDDTNAQKAVDEFVPVEVAKEIREKRSHGLGPFD